MITTIITGAIALLVGAGVSWFGINSMASTKSKRIIEDAQRDAESIKKDKLLEVKEKFISMKADLEKQISIQIGRASCRERV